MSWRIFRSVIDLLLVHHRRIHGRVRCISTANLKSKSNRLSVQHSAVLLYIYRSPCVRVFGDTVLVVCLWESWPRRWVLKLWCAEKLFVPALRTHIFLKKEVVLVYFSGKSWHTMGKWSLHFSPPEKEQYDISSMPKCPSTFKPKVVSLQFG